jgi:hypothetical protein
LDWAYLPGSGAGASLWTMARTGGVMTLASFSLATKTFSIVQTFAGAYSWGGAYSDGNDLLMCAYQTGDLYRISVTSPQLTLVTSGSMTSVMYGARCMYAPHV